jgi:SAM-dependent methyltransferase
MTADAVDAFLAKLERRHTGALTFQEIRRALQALSSLYVERRTKLGEGAALDGAGKRAAFALYYGVQHLLLVREVVKALDAAAPPPRRVLDLGCGTGSAGAAWALEAGGTPFVQGVDRSGWVVQEARQTFGDLKLRGQARTGDVERAELDGFDAVVSAYTVNELTDGGRDALRSKMLAAAAKGTRVLVLEPLARRAIGWWTEWADAFGAAGGRADEWRFPARLPGITGKLGQAAGLDTTLLTCRSLYLSRPRA